MPSNTPSWTATTLGGSFGRYLLDRLSSDGVTWKRLAEITTEATVSFIDYRARMGVAESYRVSVKQTNGTVSAPSSTASGTASVAATSLFVSPTGATLEARVNADGTVGFPRDKQWANRFGKRFPTRTRLPYDRGVTLTGTLQLVSTGTGWLNPFDALRAALDATETWTLLTRKGERKYGALDIDGGSRVIGDFAIAPFVFTETTDTPEVVVV